MRRYYVVPDAVVRAHLHLFNNSAGCMWQPLHGGGDINESKWVAAGKPVLLCAVTKNEAAQDYWHQHPEVAIMPHPVFEGKETLAAQMAKPARKVSQSHLDALEQIGIAGTHTVEDLEARAVQINIDMKLRAIL